MPKFVNEMTGLDTKRKLAANFGENVTFRRGPPRPAAPAREAGGPAVTAKPPGIRKASAA